MSSHRYWRVRRMTPLTLGDVAVTELQLLDETTRADSGATVTSDIAPLAGSLSSLADASTAGIPVRLARGTVVQWDLGTAAEVNNLAIGAGDEVRLFPFAAVLEWSADGATGWAVERVFDRIAWPGARAMTSNEQLALWSPSLGTGKVVYNAGRSVATLEVLYSGSLPSNANALPRTGSGRYQVEWEWQSSTSGIYAYFGFREEAERIQNTTRVGATSYSFGYGSNGGKNRGYSESSYGASWSTGDVIGGVLDFDAGTVEFFKNGVSQGIAYSSLTDLPNLTMYPAATVGNYGAAYDALIRTSGFTYPVVDAAPWRVFGQSIAAAPFGLGFDANRRIGLQSDSARAWPAYAPSLDLNDDTAMGRKGPFGPEYGVGFIHSTVKKKADPVNLPLRRRVRLFLEDDGRLLMETWSDAATGHYEFNNLNPQPKYFVVAFDYEHNYRATIADNLSASVPG